MINGYTIAHTPEIEKRIKDVKSGFQPLKAQIFYAIYNDFVGK